MSKITKKDLNERLLMVETLLGLHRALPEQISNNQANNAIFRMQCALSSGKEIAGRNPTEVEQRIEALEEFATYADNMLTELNHALPDPEYDAKCEAQEADIDASLDRHRERLGLNKPQLKQLDQSVFDGEPEQIKWAVVTKEGAVLKLEFKPVVKDGLWHWTGGYRQHSLIGQYDALNWQNSLIERDIAKELTGSSLCRAMLERGDKFVLCFVSDFSDEYAANQGQRINLVTHTEGNNICAKSARWKHAVPFNSRTGHPLTAKEVGL